MGSTSDYRLNYQIWGNSHSAVAIEADPFEKIFRVMFFGIYVDLCKAEFEDVAIRWHDRQYKFSTWDPHLHRIGHGDDRPVTFPRCLGKDEDKDLQGLPYCPKIKFEFRSSAQRSNGTQKENRWATWYHAYSERVKA